MENTPSKDIENEIQNSRTELQRWYPKLEKSISLYGEYSPSAFAGQKIDVFNIAFDSIDKSNFNGKLNAFNEIKEILNRAIGKLEAEGESWGSLSRIKTSKQTKSPIHKGEKSKSVLKKVRRWVKTNKLWSIIIIGIPVLAALLYVVDYFWKLFS